MGTFIQEGIFIINVRSAFLHDYTVNNVQINAETSVTLNLLSQDIKQPWNYKNLATETKWRHPQLMAPFYSL